MKFFTTALFCLSFVLTLSFPGGAAQATPVNRDQANEYFARCIASAKAPGESMRDLCACTSARILTMVSAEELAVMPEKTPAGQAAMKKMLVDVYAPCTEVVAREIFDFECVNNEQLIEMNQDLDMPQICSCAAEKTAASYKGKAQQYMGEALQKDQSATIANPLGGLLNHPQVKSQNLNNLVACSAVPAPAPETESEAEPATGTTPATSTPATPQVGPQP